MTSSTFARSLAMGIALMATAPVSGAPVSEGRVAVPGGVIQYFSRGQGETVVLLPGGGLTVGYLDPLADRLADAGYRVIAINPRGAGKSTGSGEGVTLATNADDVAGVVRALEAGPVHMVGNDFGNRVARMFAAGHPRLTRSVVLLAAGGKIPPAPDAMRALQTAFSANPSQADIAAAVPFMLANPADAPRIMGVMQASRAPAAGPIQAAAIKATPLSQWWAPPGKTRYLILQGAQDQIAPIANGADVQKALGPRAKLINVEGAGHLLPVEQPDKTADLMVDFFRSVGAKR